MVDFKLARVFAEDFRRRAKTFAVTGLSQSMKEAPEDWKKAVEIMRLHNEDPQVCVAILEAFVKLADRGVLFTEINPNSAGYTMSVHNGLPYTLIGLLASYETIFTCQRGLHDRFLSHLSATLEPSPIHSVRFVKRCLAFILDWVDARCGTKTFRSTLPAVFQSFRSVLTYDVDDVLDGSSLERVFMAMYQYVISTELRVTPVNSIAASAIRRALSVLGERVWILGSGICAELYCSLLQWPLLDSANNEDVSDFSRVVYWLQGLVMQDREIIRDSVDGGSLDFKAFLSPEVLSGAEDVLLNCISDDRKHKHVSVNLSLTAALLTVSGRRMFFSATIGYSTADMNVILEKGILGVVVRTCNSILEGLCIQKRADRDVNMVSLFKCCAAFLSAVSQASQTSALARTGDLQIVPIALRAVALFVDVRSNQDASLMQLVIGILCNYSRHNTTRTMILDDDSCTGVTLTLLLRLMHARSSVKDLELQMSRGVRMTYSEFMLVKVKTIMLELALCCPVAVLDSLAEELEVQGLIRFKGSSLHSQLLYETTLKTIHDNLREKFCAPSCRQQ